MNTPLRQLFLQHVGQTSGNPLMVDIERAEGIYMYSPQGKRYIDLISGVVVSNVGHGNPKVVAAVCEQAQKYMHLFVYGEFIESPQVMYAQKIASALPETLRSVYFVNSGSEAVEGALKLAKRYTGRREIIAFRNAYHGSTHGSLSVMGGEEFKHAFRPLLPGVSHLELDDFDALARITSSTACVIIEPVQGEAGIRTASAKYLKALRNRCDETGALLIFDEAQTAFGRTGRMFAFEHSGVVPDILVLAKALGGGMPLGAFVSSAEIMATLKTNPVLGHITTFGGHPVCCAAGLAAMEFIEENGLAALADGKGAIFEERLGGHPLVKEIRRAGLLMAVELGDQKLNWKLIPEFVEAGVIPDSFLFCESAFRIAPPLIITDEQAHRAADIVISCLDRYI